MAKKTRVSSEEIGNLRVALHKAEYSSATVVARLLVEAFLFEDGDIHAEWFVRERACSKGTFTKLRDRLVADSWLHFRDDTKRYFPGVRLKPHLEAVKASKEVTFSDLERKADRSELVNLDERKADKSSLEDTKQKLEATSAKLIQTDAELNSTKEKLAKTNQIVTKIAVAVRKLQKAKEPPITDEKVESQRQAEQEIDEHTRDLIN
jgi:hypothetical protein